MENQNMAAIEWSASKTGLPQFAGGGVNCRKENEDAWQK
jgi:hypothetical protein